MGGSSQLAAVSTCLDAAWNQCRRQIVGWLFFIACACLCLLMYWNENKRLTKCFRRKCKRTHAHTCRHTRISQGAYIRHKKKSFSLALRITSDSLSHEISALAKAVGTKKRWRQKHIGYALTPRRSCTLLRVGLTNSDLAWDVSLSLRLYQFIVRLVPGELSTIKGADVKQWSFSSLA